MVVALVLVSGDRFVASAQEMSDAKPHGDPSRIKVTARVYDTHQLLNATALPEDARRGRVLWLQHCAYCHDGVGQPSYQTMGPWLGAETVQVLGEESLRTIIRSGTARMPAFRYALQPRQMNDVIAFLKTVPSDQKPTQDQLAGKIPGAAGSDD
jgi:mono/diheme cytochrome c family protein